MWMEQAYLGDGLEWFADTLLLFWRSQSYPLKVEVLLSLPGRGLKHLILRVSQRGPEVWIQNCSCFSFSQSHVRSCDRIASFWGVAEEDTSFSDEMLSDKVSGCQVDIRCIDLRHPGNCWFGNLPPSDLWSCSVSLELFWFYFCWVLAWFISVLNYYNYKDKSRNVAMNLSGSLTN